MELPKIAIVGAGCVGATTAYTLIITNTPADIVLMDSNMTRCTGELMDLEDAHTLYQAGRHINYAPLHTLDTADIVIIAAGARQQVGESRTQLIHTNKKIIETILHQAPRLKPSALILMVSNPVDILTYHAQKITGLPYAQVFGTGTVLDSLRMRSLIAQKLRVDSSAVHAFIVGEHGDNQFPAWSSAEIGGKPLISYESISHEILAAIAEKTRERAYQIIACKGATWYGIASCITQICQAILSHQQIILPVSCYQESFDIYMSMPAILTRQGVRESIKIPLDSNEQQKFDQCVQTLKALTI